MISKVIKVGKGKNGGDKGAIKSLCDYLLKEKSHNPDFVKNRNLYVTCHNIMPIDKKAGQPFQYDSEYTAIQMGISRSKASKKVQNRRIQGYHAIFSFDDRTDFPQISKNDPDFDKKQAIQAKQAATLIWNYAKQRLGKYWPKTQCILAVQRDGSGLKDKNGKTIKGSGKKLHVHLFTSSFLTNGHVLDDRLFMQENRKYYEYDKTLHKKVLVPIVGVKDSSTAFMKKYFPIIVKRPYYTIQQKGQERDKGIIQKSNEVYINKANNHKKFIKNTLKYAINHADDLESFKKICASRGVKVIDKNRKGLPMTRTFKNPNGTKTTRPAFSYEYTYKNKEGKTITRRMRDYARTKRSIRGVGLDFIPSSIEKSIQLSLQQRQEQQEKQREEAKQEALKQQKLAHEKTQEQKQSTTPKVNKPAQKTPEEQKRQNNVIDLSKARKQQENDYQDLEQLAQDNDINLTFDNFDDSNNTQENSDDIAPVAREHSEDIGTPDMTDFKVSHASNNSNEEDTADDLEQAMNEQEKEQQELDKRLKAQQIEIQIMLSQTGRDKKFTMKRGKSKQRVSVFADFRNTLKNSKLINAMAASFKRFWTKQEPNRQRTITQTPIQREQENIIKLPYSTNTFTPQEESFYKHKFYSIIASVPNYQKKFTRKQIKELANNDFSRAQEHINPFSNAYQDQVNQEYIALRQINIKPTRQANNDEKKQYKKQIREILSKMIVKEHGESQNSYNECVNVTTNEYMAMTDNQYDDSVESYEATIAGLKDGIKVDKEYKDKFIKLDPEEQEKAQEKVRTQVQKQEEQAQPTTPKHTPTPEHKQARKKLEQNIDDDLDL